MWLLFVLVATLTNVSVHSVDQYPLETECNKKKLQFEQEFTVAYPGDKDWAFVCVYVKKGTL